MKNIAQKKNTMIKFLDEELIDEIVHNYQWKLEHSISVSTNISGMSIFGPVKVACRIGIKPQVEADMKEIFKIG